MKVEEIEQRFLLDFIHLDKKNHHWTSREHSFEWVYCIVQKHWLYFVSFPRWNYQDTRRWDFKERKEAFLVFFNYYSIGCSDRKFNVLLKVAGTELSLSYKKESVLREDFYEMVNIVVLIIKYNG